jgi:YedE family putative selenium metabolism protein
MLGVLWLACALVGALAGLLVFLGNPGNMGLCGACFLRDTAGAFGFIDVTAAPKIFRPELVGLVLGACLLRAARQTFEGRAGSYAGARFFLGFWMGIGTLVFLGCPFRMLQRIGGGDLNAVVALVGFIAGVGIGRVFETRGYTAGKTAVISTPVGLPGVALAILGLAWFLLAPMPRGPGPGEETGSPHAPWGWSLALAAAAGAILSWTGFCAVSAGRQVFAGPRRMLVAALFLMAGYALFSLASGSFKLGFDGQPVAHQDHTWSVLAMMLVGLTGVLAGGCPVRLIVLTGEGNGDAMVTAAGILLGGAAAHTLDIVSKPTGATPNGQVAVVVGLVLCTAYAVAVTAARPRSATP